MFSTSSLPQLRQWSPLDFTCQPCKEVTIRGVSYSEHPPKKVKFFIRGNQVLLLTARHRYVNLKITTTLVLPFINAPHPRTVPWSSSTGETVVVVGRRNAHGIQSADGWCMVQSRWRGTSPSSGRWGLGEQR